MKTLEISYNPYKMITKMFIDGIDVCERNCYDKFSEFIKNEIPLQTWMESIPYLDWNGLVNEVSDPERNDEVKVVFSGRVIDFEDLKRSITDQNEKRKKHVEYHFEHKKVLDDKTLSQNIDEVVKELKSDQFRELVNQRTTEGWTPKYEVLEKKYSIAKENELYIVFVGAYSSGKSILVNTIMRHNILPAVDETCTSKNCRIRHDGNLKHRVTLACFDKEDKVIGEKRVFENDADCAAAFLEICPIQDSSVEDKHIEIDTMELGVDLSHLYPDSVNDDKFTIVLIDTPGMDSLKSSEDGFNKHAEIALDAISMESKPMIVLCVDGQYYEQESIGGFMRGIIARSQGEKSGFNDRFLFLMNNSENVKYNQNGSPESTRENFAKYLTDVSKWGIKEDSKEERQLAENASHFVPRVFMTTALIAFAIQQKAYAFTDEETKDDNKRYLKKAYKEFEEKICERKHENFYLSRYCDIPNYRKNEIEAECNATIDNDKVRATQLQCGLVSVESAIKDYIERYAYPIKVRGLLDTFEDILKDINDGVLADLKQKEIELGEKESEREEASGRKKDVEEKIAALKKVEKIIEVQFRSMDEIKIDSTALKRAIAEFRADIESDKEILFIRQHPIIRTGPKSRDAVEYAIDDHITKIKALFDRTLDKTNKELEEIKNVYNKQILDVFDLLGAALVELEESGVLLEGEYKFTDSAFWKMNFANINVDSLFSDMQKGVHDKSSSIKWERNREKDSSASSRNIFKGIPAWFMNNYKFVVDEVDGYYETTEITKSIDAYLLDLQRESEKMEKSFESVMENSKCKVKELIAKLIQEVERFHEDIKKQEEEITKIDNSIEKLDKEIATKQATVKRLHELKKKIVEE